MKCKQCNTDNPEGAVFCRKCGKPLTQDGLECPSCKHVCPPTAHFCAKCGATLPATEPAMPANEPTMSESEPLIEAPSESQPVAEPPKKEAPKSRGIGEHKQKKLNLASGILMMGAVFLSLIFVFFIGVDYKVSEAGYYYSTYETYTIWHYFGRAYTLLESSMIGHGYSNYTVATNYISVVLSTVIAAGTLISTVTFTIIATIKFGLHCRKNEERYYKYAVAAVFSFILGATLFDCIHDTYTQNNSASLSGATTAGLVFCCILIMVSLILRTISIGNRFRRKQAVLDCVCTLLGILFLAMTSGFADTAQADYSVLGSYRASYSISFFQLNNTLSLLYTSQSTVPADFVATFTFALLAIMAQIAVQVLAFYILIKRIGNYTEERTFSLKTSIALAATAAVYLTFSAISLEFANGVIPANYREMSQLWLSSAPIMTFVASLMHLTVSIMHKVVDKKGERDEEAKADATI